MSVSRLNYKVEIDPHRAVYSQDNAEIGLFSGKLVWVTNYDATYTSANSKAGVLAENWISSIKKSVQASRKGNTASIGLSSVAPIASALLVNQASNILRTIKDTSTMLAVFSHAQTWNQYCLEHLLTSFSYIRSGEVNCVILTKPPNTQK